MSVNDYLRCHDALEAIVMAMHDQVFNLAEASTFSFALAILREDIIIVATHHYSWRFSVLGEYYLVVMAVDGNTGYAVLFFDIK